MAINYTALIGFLKLAGLFVMAFAVILAWQRAKKYLSNLLDATFTRIMKCFFKRRKR